MCVWNFPFFLLYDVDGCIQSGSCVDQFGSTSAPGATIANRAASNISFRARVERIATEAGQVPLQRTGATKGGTTKHPKKRYLKLSTKYRLFRCSLWCGKVTPDLLAKCFTGGSRPTVTGLPSTTLYTNTSCWRCFIRRTTRQASTNIYDLP